LHSPHGTEQPCGPYFSASGPRGGARGAGPGGPGRAFHRKSRLGWASVGRDSRPNWAGLLNRFRGAGPFGVHSFFGAILAFNRRGHQKICFIRGAGDRSALCGYGPQGKKAGWGWLSRNKGRESEKQARKTGRGGFFWRGEGPTEAVESSFLFRPLASRPGRFCGRELVGEFTFLLGRGLWETSPIHGVLPLAPLFRPQGAYKAGLTCQLCSSPICGTAGGNTGVRGRGPKKIGSWMGQGSAATRFRGGG